MNNYLISQQLIFGSVQRDMESADGGVFDETAYLFTVKIPPAKSRHRWVAFGVEDNDGDLTIYQEVFEVDCLTKVVDNIHH